MRYKSKGFLNGIFASVSYGTNPLFALPMYKLGLGANSVLFYRYFFAILIYGIYLKFFRKTSLKVSPKELCCIAFIGILFGFSSIALFEAFNYIDSGIACTILFIYPVIVALISGIFFKEKISLTMVYSMMITLCGIFILNGGINGHLNPKGISLVLLSALAYAIYILLVKNLKPIKHLKYDKLSFYVMLFGLTVFIFNLKFCTQLQPMNDIRLFLCSIALAIFPTIISLETINIAIRIIGPTTTSVLGALEPLTAIFFGLLFFSEKLTLNNIFGIFLILSGVILLISKQSIHSSKNNP